MENVKVKGYETRAVNWEKLSKACLSAFHSLSSFRDEGAPLLQVQGGHFLQQGPRTCFQRALGWRRHRGLPASVLSQILSA